jgi:streptogramin lyase
MTTIGQDLGMISILLLALAGSRISATAYSTYFHYLPAEDGDFYSTSTALAVTPPNATAGSPVILTAQVSGLSSNWSGVTISFYTDGNLVGTAATDSSAQAHLLVSTMNLAAGPHTFRADFPLTKRSQNEVVAKEITYAADGATIRQVDYYIVPYRNTAEDSSGATQFSTLAGQPLILSLTNQTAKAGTTIRFSVTPTTLPLSYHWLFNFTNLVGETNATLDLTNVQTNQSGIYMVIAHDPSGLMTCSSASLSVGLPAEITMQPQSQTAFVGSTVTFSVTAAGTPPLSYQWHKDGSNLPGASNATYIVANVQTNDAGIYSVVVSNAVDSKTSTNALLTVQPEYYFTTLAGLARSSGSANGLGKQARFKDPSGVAVDRNGNLYLADTYNHTIRKVTPEGEVTSLAGLAGSSGSTDGTGNAARFNGPFGVAVDNKGDVYVADTYNHTIRKVTSSGEVTTLAGLAGSRGSENGTGNAARFAHPYAVAVDSAGNLYVADTFNHTIRKVTSAGEVTTLAGLAGSRGSENGLGNTARFFNPRGVTVDNKGNVYVADTYNHTIRKVTSDGEATTLAGLAGSSGSADGTGNAARFFTPHGVVVDSAGNLYVADTFNYTIRMVTPAREVTTLAGLAGASGSTDGMGHVARFSSLGGITVDGAGNLYAADTINQTIRKAVPPVGVISPNTLQVQFMPDGRFRLQFRHTDDSLPSNLSRLEVQWRTDLPNGTDTNWQSVTTGFEIIDGWIRFDDLSILTQPRRFYRVLER